MLYQLLRTTPLLTGQVRHDLVVNDVEVDRLVLAPIADSITYNENEPRPLMNYNHISNLHYMYSLLGDDFFNCTQKYTGNKYIYNGGKQLDTHDYTYLSGLKRLRYQRYNKQYSFLCPVWITETIDFNDIQFHIKLQGCDSNFLNIEKVVKLNKDLVRYYNEYVEGINDDLLNLKLDTNEAFITGVDVFNGCKVVRDVSYVIANILNREKPLMEVDNTLVTLFKDSGVVSQQLINFNVCFDIYDLTTQEIVDSLVGIPLNITVDVLYQGKPLAKKDIYSNYEYIPATELRDNKIYYLSGKEYNVLGYLNDNNNIDYVYKNKLTQPIFHWSLLENPSFTYNLYDGFAPNIYLTEEGEYFRINGQYYNQGDLSSARYDIFDNNLAWCDFADYSQLSNEVLRVKITEDDNEHLYTDINLNENITWFNNNKYDITGIDKGDIEKISVRIIKIRENHNPQLGDFFDKELLNDVLKVYADRKGGHVTFIILSSNEDLLTIGSLKMIDLGSPEWSVLRSVLEGYIKPYRIEFKNTVAPIPVRRLEDVPSLKEIEYCKVDEYYSSYVYRYFGKLIPQFIDPTDKNLVNYLYYYEQWSDMEEEYMKRYNSLLLKEYIPNYPSLEIGDGHSFYALRSEVLTQERPNSYNGWEWEVGHLFDNKFFVMPINITLVVEIPNAIQNTEEENDNIIHNSIIDKLVSMGFAEGAIPYILDLYERKITFEYKSVRNIKDIVYKINFKLK